MMKRLVAALAATVLGAGIAVAAVAAPAAANSTCTYTQGYYKNHATYLASRLDTSSLTHVLQAAITSYFGVPNTTAGLITIYRTPPKGGNADLIAAHQLITTAANGSPSEKGDFGSAAINTAYYSLVDYFQRDPGAGLTRAQIIAYAAVLDAYNNGRLTLPHCG